MSPPSPGTVPTTTANAITANTTPDIAMVGTTWMGEFAQLDALDRRRQHRQVEFFPGAQATTEVDGTSYGIPWYAETRLVISLRGTDFEMGAYFVPQNRWCLLEMRIILDQRSSQINPRPSTPSVIQ